MRYGPTHKARTRERIVETAGREFRRRGVDGLSVADIMRAEGLTHGGFYRHFRDKDALLIEAIEAALEQVADHLLEATTELPRGQALRRAIDLYLSEEHLHHPHSGCALAALGTEIARFPQACRAPIARALDRYRKRLEPLLPGDTDIERKANFDVLFPSMAGCLMAARAYVDPERKTEILRQARGFFSRAFCQTEITPLREQS